MKKVLLIIVILIMFVGLYIYVQKDDTDTQSTSTQEQGIVNPSNSLIQVDFPVSNTIVTSPLSITGKARGFWFFEASFPVVLIDGNGKKIAVSFATAQNEWMTEEFVPFIASITFKKPETATGTLILQKDNPSGDPVRDDEVRISVQFY